MATLFPGPISPRCDPDLLGQVSHDPFGVLPQAFPGRPHVGFTPAQIRRTRQRVKTCQWAARCLERLLHNCRKGLIPAESDGAGQSVPDLICLILRNAMAFHLTEQANWLDQAQLGFRRLLKRVRQNGLSAHCGLVELGQAYDLLQATGLTESDTQDFSAVLQAGYKALDSAGHYTCGNVNTWMQTGRLTLALAWEDRQGIHDALYGCGRGPQWRYGLIHQLRHDLLSDGLHWERTAGYHFYALMGFATACDFLANSGVDFWHREWPTLKQDDGFDLHRAYGPSGTKTIQDAFDAPFYLTFPNGDLSLLSDSGLAHIRGVWIWGILYNKAYEAYRDPKYAWLLNRMEKEYRTREFPGVPMPLQTRRGDFDFVRLADETYPRGHWTLDQDCRISLSGCHQKRATLFPDYGAALLRGGSVPTASGAFLYYGPHAAGHQTPAALHVDLHVGGERLTDAPRLGGYEDPLYLTWGRTTLAGNTLVVDERSMFPYDFPTESIWECDRWRDGISDGELVGWEPGSNFSSVRAINRRVYPGVLLDRTVVVSTLGILDLFRVEADRVRQFDYVWHALGQPSFPDGSQCTDLGTARGYQHLKNGRRVPLGGGRTLAWSINTTSIQVALGSSHPALLICADEPPPFAELGFGEFKVPQERKTLMIRSRRRSVVMASFWTACRDSLSLSLGAGERPGDWVVIVQEAGHKIQWNCPQTGPVTTSGGNWPSA